MWTFENGTGRMLDPMGNLVATGYAGGDEGRHPEGVNNPDMQYVKSIGPLPVGLYYLGTPVPQSRLGKFAIPLTPDKNNIMKDRGGFFVHGDTTPSGNASEGCIIMPRAVRNAMWASSDHTVQVV